MAKKTSELPNNPTSLGRWLALDPKARLPQLQRVVQAAKGKSESFELERARIALKQAWDEQPTVFFSLASDWLSSADWRLRFVATGAIPASHEEFAEKSLRLLKKQSNDSEARVRRLAIDLIADDINGNFELVKRWMKDGDPAVRAIAAHHVRNLDTDRIKPEISVLEPVLEDASPDVQWAVASTCLELYHREPRPVIETIKAMAFSEDESVRGAAAGAFFQHAFADYLDPLLPTMRAWLRDESPALRWTLAHSLRFVLVTPRSIQLLRALYEDQDVEIRRRLSFALVDLYDPLKESRRLLLPLLCRALNDPAKRVRDPVEDGQKRLEADFAAELELAVA